jgi:hypothetical protein
MSSCWSDNKREVFSIQINVTGGTKYDYLIPVVIHVYVKLRENLFLAAEAEYIRGIIYNSMCVCVCVCPGIARVSGNCTRRYDACQAFAEDFMLELCKNIVLPFGSNLLFTATGDLKVGCTTNKRNSTNIFINRQARQIFFSFVRECNTFRSCWPSSGFKRRYFEDKSKNACSYFKISGISQILNFITNFI